MKNVNFVHPHRIAHFNFFNRMSHPHFSITANVDVTNLIAILKEEGFPFTPSVVYLISKTANEIQEFRWRIRNEQVVEHSTVHPSFSVYTDAADVFSFCEVKFEHDFSKFINQALKKIAAMKDSPIFSDEHGRDDYLFLSAIPWVSFTGFQHAMNYHPTDSVPRIVWGKYFEEKGKIKMPLSVQVHHALVDGRHVGRFFENFEKNITALIK